MGIVLNRICSYGMELNIIMVFVLGLVLSHSASAAANNDVETGDASDRGNRGQVLQSGPIEAGDIIQIEMKEHDKMNFKGEVSGGGTVSIPYYGEFRIAGLKPEKAEATLEKELTRDLYYEATIAVTVLERAPGKVFVYGAVKKPGMVTMPKSGKATLLQVLSTVGGLNRWAVPENAYIMRSGDSESSKERISIDLSQRLSPLADKEEVNLEAGDILFVPGLGGDNDVTLSSEGTEVIVVGQVNRPGIVQFAPGEKHTMMRAIFKAGGMSEFAKASKVKLIHYTPDGERKVKEVDMDAVLSRGELTKDVDVKTGDMVLVPAKMINL